MSDLIEGAYLNATVSLSFTLDPEMENEYAESLSPVVKERNALIHQMLVSFDPNSSSSREALGRKLDEQLDRILPEYQLLHSLLAGIRESLEMAESELDAGKPRGHD